ncbi:MAG: hypothetical protein AAGI44_13400 [Pseudomonadota bacterium]
MTDNCTGAKPCAPNDDDRPLQFNSVDINLRRYFFAQIYGQLCAQAFRYYLETGQTIIYADVAESARHMTEAGLKEVTDGEGE